MSKRRTQNGERRTQNADIRGQQPTRAHRGVRIGHLPLSVCCLFLSASCLLPPAFCSVVQAAELKIGYVNLLKIFDGYQHKQESEQVLEQKGKQKQAELEGRFNELKKMRQSLELLNDQAKDAKAREIEEKADEFKRLKERTERDLVRERNELAKQVLEEIDGAVADYAKANGYSLMLDQRSLLYGEELYDVTDDILKALNARYTNKAAKH